MAFYGGCMYCQKQNITKVTLEGLLTGLPGATHGMKKSKSTYKTPK